jgi:ABC-2 type transport system permease protein
MSIAWHRISAIIWRQIYLLPRSFDRLTDCFFWPVLDVLVWGITAEWLSRDSSTSSSMVLAIMLSFVMWRMVWFSNYEISINLVEEGWNRNFTNLLATPLTKLEWTIGNIIVGLLKLTTVVIFTALTVWLTYSLNIFDLGVVWIPLTAILITFGWSVGLIASAVILSLGIRAQALSWTLAFVFLPLCAAYAPVSMLPSWVQSIAWVFPATYAFEAMRSVVFEGVLPWDLIYTGMACALGFLVLGLAAVNWCFERTRLVGFDHLE